MTKADVTSQFFFYGLPPTCAHNTIFFTHSTKINRGKNNTDILHFKKKTTLNVH